MASTVKKRVEIAADPAKVWDALTNPQITRLYFFNCEVVSDWGVGDSITFTEFKDEGEVDHVKGKILAYEPEKLLEYTAFSPRSGLADIPENYTTVQFEMYPDPMKNLTQLIVSQGDFGDDDNRFFESKIAWEHVLNSLKRIVE